MKIAITQRQFVINEIIHDCLDPQWYSFLYPHELIPIPNNGNMISDFDILIISGGESGLARTITEVTYYQTALRRNIPIIGVCHGAFFINKQHTNGVTGVTLPSHKKDIIHPIEMDGSVYAVNSFHSASIEYDMLGDDLIPVATHHTTSNHVTIEAFEHKALPIYGIVWHPERMERPVLPRKVEELLHA